MNEKSKIDPSRYIFNLVTQDLGKVPFHFDADGISRLTAQGLPVHLAVHLIGEQSASAVAQYVLPHKHTSPELNLILSEKGQLIYQITIGNEEFEVQSPAAVWIPPDISHAAKYVKGFGCFACLVLEKKYHAFDDSEK